MVRRALFLSLQGADWAIRLGLMQGNPTISWRLRTAACLMLAGAAPLAAQPVTPPAPARQERPIEVFAALPAFSGPRLSPDGTRIAVKLTTRGQQVLAIISLAEPGARPALIIGDPSIDINSWTWVNDDWLVLGVGTMDRIEAAQDLEQEVYVTRLIGVDRQARTMNRLGWDNAAQMASDIVWVARDGSPRLLFAKQTSFYLGADFWPKVFEADISTGRTRQVVGSQEYVLNWFADASGAVRMGYGYNDRTGAARLIYRATGEGSFQTIARANTRHDESVPAPVMFLPDTSRAVAISDEDGFDAIYEMSLPDLTLGRRIYGVAGYDVEALYPTPAGDRISGILHTGRRPTVVWRDLPMRQAQANLDVTFGEGNAQIISWSRDRSRLLVRVGGPSQAGAYYSMDVAANATTLVGWLSDTLRDQQLAPVRTIRYRARDGVEIEAVLTLPPGREARGLPVIVMPHGGPYARDDESWDWMTQFLADRGYAVIQPNYRGSSGYGARFAELGRGEWGRKMQDDLDDALAWLATEGIGDRTRACILGASYGGYAALRAAQRTPQLYRCAVSYAGVSDLGALARYDRSFLNSRGRGQWLTAQAPDFRSVSPINFAADFSIPVLMMHGDRDLVVPVAESRRMAARLRSAGKAHSYIEQAGADHHFSRTADRLQFLQQVDAFLDRYNPSEANRPPATSPAPAPAL